MKRGGRFEEASSAAPTVSNVMKMLTLTQPWATLVAVGAKRIETRSWHTSYRGPIAIHAAKGLNGLFRGASEDDLLRICASVPFCFAIDRAGVRIDELPRGAIVAVADLVDVRSTDDPVFVGPISASVEREFGDYSPGRYGWVLHNVRKLPVPYEIRGERGLQTLDPRVARYIVKETEVLA